MSGQTLRCREMIPLSLWQQKVNQLFYRRDDSPLDHLGTLGGADPLLPQAMAREFLQDNNGAKTVHEIGPGKFNFARHFVDEAKPTLDELAYRGHDFSETSYAFVKPELEPYGQSIQFNRTSLSEFPRKVTDDPLQAILVEVLDDVATEFFARHEGREYMLHVRPEMNGGLFFPSKKKYARIKIDGGNFSLAIRRAASSEGMEKTYHAREIIGLINSLKWDELDKIHPSFLKWLRYTPESKVFNPFSLDQLYLTHWKDVPDEFRTYGGSIINHFRDQLSHAEEDRTVHFPVGGLEFLWSLRERKNARVDFFDYGYASAKNDVEHMAVYNGQITAPVNFELLKYAAEWLGFNARLETNREFIRRTLGEDTIPIAYVFKAFNNSSLTHANVRKLLYDCFHKKIVELCPKTKPTIDNFMAFRVRRDAYETVIDVAKEKGFVKPDFEMSEGSFHLAAYKRT
ncbi:MAG: hypothetical protein QT04_C0060G0010 [archaeon GW2011_AR11]|nr:MAG: hypothetical protein QT04_C0060G0010 [archaeon GW2011_AR11]